MDKYFSGNAFKFLIFFNLLTFKEFWISLALSREVNHTCSVLWLAVRRWCHTFMCTRSINSGSSLSWQRKMMIRFMVSTNPDWSGLVLSTQNLSYNSEFVHLSSWYRPQDTITKLTQISSDTVIHEQILQNRRRENEQTALYIWQTPDHWFMSTGTKHYTTQSSSIFSTHFICFVFTCFSCLLFYFDYHSVSTNTIRYNNNFILINLTFT